MALIKEYLSSATIHGLSFIGNTQKFVQLFWIFVVVSAFSSAAFLIKSAFQSWSENPILTNIETFDIMELRLPQVTVCPPKDTFTSLNYDIAKKSNKNLTDAERRDLAVFSLERIEEAKIKKIMDKEFEDEMFYNWYQAKVKININSEDEMMGPLKIWKKIKMTLIIHFPVNQEPKVSSSIFQPFDYTYRNILFVGLLTI